MGGRGGGGGKRCKMTVLTGALTSAAVANWHETAIITATTKNFRYFMLKRLSEIIVNNADIAAMFHEAAAINTAHKAT